MGPASRLTACFAAGLALLPSAMAGQSKAQLGAGAQYVGFDGPLGGFSGAGLFVSVSKDVSRWLTLRADADFAAVSAGDHITLCIPVGTGCLATPASQSLAGLAGVLELHPPLRAVSPFVAAGPGSRWVLGRVVPGTRRTWVQPSAEAGVRIAPGTVEWVLAVRWRRVHEWLDRGPYAELGLLVGFRL